MIVRGQRELIKFNHSFLRLQGIPGSDGCLLDYMATCRTAIPLRLELARMRDLEVLLESLRGYECPASHLGSSLLPEVAYLTSQSNYDFLASVALPLMVI